MRSKISFWSDIGPLKVRGQDTTDEQIKADSLAKYFNSSHRVDRGDPGAFVLDNSSQAAGNLLMTEEDLRMQLEGLNKNKSVGPNGIHSVIIKPLAVIVVGVQTILGHKDQGKIPKDWRSAAVTLIHKGGPSSLMENFRPVSLTSILCKVMEKLI